MSIFCCGLCLLYFVFLFFFNDTATTEIYTLSLHDALPISRIDAQLAREAPVPAVTAPSPRSHDSARTSSPQSHPASRVVFAQGRVVLGPRGRRAVAALAQRVATTRQVTVRGYLTKNEFPLADPLDAERRSVGRSLSVKDAWRNAGVDVSSVTILHHSGEFAGAFVEVVFGD